MIGEFANAPFQLTSPDVCLVGHLTIGKNQLRRAEMASHLKGSRNHIQALQLELWTGFHWPQATEDFDFGNGSFWHQNMTDAQAQSGGKFMMKGRRLAINSIIIDHPNIVQWWYHRLTQRGLLNSGIDK
jgi:hypothetical protein